MDSTRVTNLENSQDNSVESFDFPCIFFKININTCPTEKT